MRIHIVGAGSLGMLYGARLTSHCQVKLFTHTIDQAKKISEETITLTSLTGEVHSLTPAVSFFHHPEFITGEKPDWIFLTIKQKDLTPEVMSRIVQGMGAATNLLCFQNGLGHADKLTDYIPSQRLWVAVTTEAARKTSACSVLHTGKGRTLFGHALPATTVEDGGRATNRLVQSMDAAGLVFTFSECMKKEVWEKLIVNAVINPLTALLRIPNGELCHEKERLNLMKDLFTEAIAVSEAEGVHLSIHLWDKILEVCRSTAVNRSSMLQDVEGRRVTENEWISGAIRRTAQLHQVEVPVTDIIYRLIRTLDHQ
ncbi:MAG: 2-dehydropantoate 2-reductase [Gorillibacterium sp.]|nr:2-dehydropantoate 2-reductase [Gorillibacterium sp.]